MSSQTAARPAALKDCRLYREAEAMGPTYAMALETDCIECTRDGITMDDYLDALESWDGNLASYLEQAGAMPAGADDEAMDNATIAGATVVQVNDDEENEKRAAAERAQLKSAEKAYAKCEGFVRKAGKSVCENLLNAGKWGFAFVLDKQMIPHDRSSAIKSLDAMLNLLSPVAVDAGQLIASYHAYRLLCEGTELQDATVRYTDYQMHWARLVVRTTEQRDGKKLDSYVILAGLEERARASFAQLVGNGAPAATVKERVNELLAAHANEVNKAKQLAAQEAKEKEETARKAREQADAITRQAAQDAEKAKAVALQAAQVVVACPDDAKAAADKLAADAAAKAAADKFAADAAAKQEALHAEDKARRDREQKEADAKRASVNVTRANDRLAPRSATGAAPRSATRAPGDGPVNPLQPLIKSAAQGSPVDVAGWALQLLVASSDRHGAFRALLDMVSRSKDMDKRCHRAANNALISLNAPEIAQS